MDGIFVPEAGVDAAIAEVEARGAVIKKSLES